MLVFTFALLFFGLLAITPLTLDKLEKINQI